jgi:hydroxyethylthiazole kinase-like uncharacterized protein yjeF
MSTRETKRAEMQRQALTSAQMRAIEAAAIASGRVSGAQLMERAGAGAAREIAERWPQAAAGGRVLVLCGPGNNGGDGFVIARRLAEQGARPTVLLAAARARLSGDAAAMASAWERIGETIPADPGEMADRVEGGGYDLAVDALFGTGLARPLSAAFAPLAEAWSGLDDGRTAVDIPSGLDSDTGRADGPALAADLTVTFHAPKRGHLRGAGPALCGELRTVDIGLGSPADSGA